MPRRGVIIESQSRDGPAGAPARPAAAAAGWQRATGPGAAGGAPRPGDAARSPLSGAAPVRGRAAIGARVRAVCGVAGGRSVVDSPIAHHHHHSMIIDIMIREKCLLGH